MLDRIQYDGHITHWLRHCDLDQLEAERAAILEEQAHILREAAEEAKIELLRELRQAERGHAAVLTTHIALTMNADVYFTATLVASTSYGVVRGFILRCHR